MEQPAWMSEVAPEDMTDEQKVAIAAYQKRVAVLKAERETRRKLLETELSKVDDARWRMTLRPGDGTSTASQ